eukprot:7221738-Pyramimonas_sp.AAC.1
MDDRAGLRMRSHGGPEEGGRDPTRPQDADSGDWKTIDAAAFIEQGHGAVLPERGSLELLGIKTHVATVDQDTFGS